MNVRYYIDADTGLPHIYQHGVREDEVEEIVRRPLENRPGEQSSRVLIGQTRNGRYLRVIVSIDWDVRLARQRAQSVAPTHEKTRQNMKKKLATRASRRRPAANDANQYPPGLDRRKIRAIISHYENQTVDQAVTEDEAAYHDSAVTMMGVPTELVPKVQALIARRSG